mgnify:CR=1 FL=1
MPKTSSQNDGRRLRVGSLFSGYGGLDLAVEHVFNAGASAKAVKLARESMRL